MVKTQHVFSKDYSDPRHKYLPMVHVHILRTFGGEPSSNLFMATHGLVSDLVQPSPSLRVLRNTLVYRRY